MKNFAKLLTTALMIGCLAAGIAGCGGSEGGKDAAAVKQTVIYTNSDEEAQTAMKNALDKNGFEGKYIMQSFGTSELGGKLAAETVTRNSTRCSLKLKTQPNRWQNTPTFMCLCLATAAHCL